MTENWTIVGPTLEHGIDPETGDSFEYGMVCAFLLADGVEHGAGLTCSADVARDPESYPNVVALLKELAKDAVRGRF